jgi:hypothetical protein
MLQYVDLHIFCAVNFNLINLYLIVQKNRLSHTRRKVNVIKHILKSKYLRDYFTTDYTLLRQCPVRVFFGRVR